MKKRLWLFLPFLLPLFSCGGSGAEPLDYQELFFYHPTSSSTLGEHRNTEEHPYGSLTVNPITGDIRRDFAMGVDASMVYEVMENGGLYYNKKGREQDVFEILRDNGVNFIRLRLWNDPKSKDGHPYGGGDNAIDVDLALAKKAKKAGLNILLDFHYSDFFADPAHQVAPKAWKNLKTDEIPAQIKTFTRDTLNRFRENGVNIDAVQIGNEINNGLAGFRVDYDKPSEGYSIMASFLSAGIEGAKEAFPEVKSIVHLANGEKKEECESFFLAMEERKLDYDICGVSYYPFLGGKKEDLQSNLDNLANKTRKPVMVVETSWGFTDRENAYCQNTYTSSYEEIGGYLTSEQAQATALRDVIDAVSKVPNHLGLGVFYWEGAWLPERGCGWTTSYGQSYQEKGSDEYHNEYQDGLCTWANQALFSYTGKALSSLSVFSNVKKGKNVKEVAPIRIRNLGETVLNLDENDVLPPLFLCETSVDSLLSFPASYSKADIEKVKEEGLHSVEATIGGTLKVTLDVRSVRNLLPDHGFENQGYVLSDPWKAGEIAPKGSDVLRLDRSGNARSGEVDLNWYADSPFSFDFYQEIELIPGEYSLLTYLMGVSKDELPHAYLEMYVSFGGSERSADLPSLLEGYVEGGRYQRGSIPSFRVSSTVTARIGLRGKAPAKAWGHNDDWLLYRL